MQDNNPQALIEERLIRARSCPQTETTEAIALKDIRARYEQELRSLAKFICGNEYIFAEKRLWLDNEVMTRATERTAGSQLPYLRQELIVAAVRTFRREIKALLRPYEDKEICSDIPSKFPLALSVLPPLDHCSEPLNILHRVVLIMIFREGYVLRTCGAILGCSDTTVDQLKAEGLMRIRSA